MADFLADRTGSRCLELPFMAATKEAALSTESFVPESVLVELQRSFFGLISNAESAKSERIKAKLAYDEKARAFEEARKALFEVAEFLHKHQAKDKEASCDWVAVAKSRLEAIEQ